MSLCVVGPWGGLGMVLDRENRVFPVLDPFHGAVVEVEVRHFERFRTRNACRLAPDGKAVVL